MPNEDKDYAVLNNIDEMYAHYLKQREETIEERKNSTILIHKDNPVKDGLALQFLRYPILNEEKIGDEEWDEVSKKPLSFEDFKTALIYHMVICMEGSLEYLEPSTCSVQKYWVEDTLDDNFG